MKPKVSVLMSAYNNRDYIKAALDSILNQTFTNFELIIIDDCSTDGTREIIREYEKTDKRIVAIYKRKNCGQPGFVRNLIHGVDIARGKYIARMDGDDVSGLTRFEKQIKILDTRPEIFLIASSARIIDEKEKFIFKVKLPVSSNKIKKILLNQNRLVHSSIMFRNTGEFNYRPKIYLAQDYDLYLNILTSGKKISAISEPLISFRIYSEDKKSLGKKELQILFSDKSREFYWQRINFGSDGYNHFNPNIIKIDPKNNNSKKLLEFRICRNVKRKNLSQARKLCLEYLKKYNRFDLLINFLYLSSRFPVFLDFLRQVSRLFRLSSWR